MPYIRLCPSPPPFQCNLWILLPVRIAVTAYYSGFLLDILHPVLDINVGGLQKVGMQARVQYCTAITTGLNKGYSDTGLRQGC